MLHLLHRAVSRRGARLGAALLMAALPGIAAPGIAWGGACREEVAASLGGRKGLYVQTADGAWRPYGRSAAAGSIRRFAYVGRLTDEMSGREGAVVVRFARLRGPQDSEARTVGLRRPDAAPTCGTRALRLLGVRPFNWGSLDFVGGQRVGVDIFIAHHLADQDVSSVITNFHVDYRSLDEGCVSTQKNVKGRRTAFLAETDDDAERAVPTVARKVMSSLGFSSTALAGPAGGAGRVAAGYGERFRKEREAFAAFGAVETQIHTYPLTGRNMCVSFAPSRAIDASAGARWSVEIVDLDAPRQRPRRDRYSIDWR